MATENLMAQKAQNPKDLEYLEIIERLSRDARYEFLLKFEDDLRKIVSPAAISKARKRDFHFKNETILAIIKSNPEARLWLKRNAREEALKLLQMAENLEV